MQGFSTPMSDFSLVRGGEESRRHSGSRDHFEAILAPASERDLQLWQLRWIIYKPHWKVDGNKAVALQFTFLKRSWQAESEIMLLCFCPNLYIPRVPM
jgi:hypothetical protein